MQIQIQQILQQIGQDPRQKYKNKKYDIGSEIPQNADHEFVLENFEDL